MLFTYISVGKTMRRYKRLDKKRFSYIKKNFIMNFIMLHSNQTSNSLLLCISQISQLLNLLLEILIVGERVIKRLLKLVVLIMRCEGKVFQAANVSVAFAVADNQRSSTLTELNYRQLFVVKRSDRSRFLVLSSQIPNLNRILRATGDDRRVNRAPVSIVNRTETIRQFHDRLEDVLDPDPNRPITSGGEENLRRERRKVDCINAAVVNLQDSDVLVRKVGGADMNASLIGADQVNVLIHRMLLKAQSLRMAIGFDERLLVLDGQSFDGSFDAIQS